MLDRRSGVSSYTGATLRDIQVSNKPGQVLVLDNARSFRGTHAAREETRFCCVGRLSSASGSYKVETPRDLPGLLFLFSSRCRPVDRESSWVLVDAGRI